MATPAKLEEKIRQALTVYNETLEDKPRGLLGVITPGASLDSRTEDVTDAVRKYVDQFGVRQFPAALREELTAAGFASAFEQDVSRSR